MIDFGLKYQASIFLVANDITPTPDTIKTFIDLFSDKGLVPNTFREISPGSPAPRGRLRLSSPNNEWNIKIASTRIDIEKNPISLKENNLGNVNDFCLEVTDFLGRIISKFPKKVNRVALITNLLLKEMAEPNLSEVYLKLFKPPEFYANHPPFEWNWRSASRIPSIFGEFNENLNVITQVNRVSVEMGLNEEITFFDRIQFFFDLNTSQENAEYRFDINFITTFYQEISAFHDDLVTKITEFING
jgi:hypothetical protein